ncbi:MAG: O-antigen ligase domain-containing protein [Bacteroidota bacterium]
MPALLPAPPPSRPRLLAGLDAALQTAWLGPLLTVLVTFGGSLLTGLLVIKAGFVIGIVLGALPAVLIVVGIVYAVPISGLYAAVAVSFFGPGLSRYVPAPTGLMLDGFLVLTLAVIAVRWREGRYDADRLKNVFVFMAVAWLGLTGLQIANPLSPGPVAWFYAGRGTTFYVIQTALVALLLIQRQSQLQRLIWIWLGLSFVGTLWGAKQLFLGLDAAEQAWLSVPGNLSTHVLFGKLRVFSFYSDAGQFGAAQGCVGIVGLILAVGPYPLKRRLLYGVLGLAGVYGLLISGTRGAMAVPAAGALTYLVLSRNIKMMVAGSLAIIALYSVLMFTSIGSGIYAVQRFRAGLKEGGENNSLKVRHENQMRLKGWLAGHPLGGGVGSAGSWGQRFAPGTFLANLALDSWYVRIMAEYGVFGMRLYILGLLIVLAVAARRMLAVKDRALQHTLLALLAGACGIAAASYGNQVLGQMPTSPFIYVSVAACYLAPYFDQEIEDSAKGDEAA